MKKILGVALLTFFIFSNMTFAYTRESLYSSETNIEITLDTEEIHLNSDGSDFTFTLAVTYELEGEQLNDDVVLNHDGLRAYVMRNNGYTNTYHDEADNYVDGVYTFTLPTVDTNYYLINFNNGEENIQKRVFIDNFIEPTVEVVLDETPIYFEKTDEILSIEVPVSYYIDGELLSDEVVLDTFRTYLFKNDGEEWGYLNEVDTYIDGIYHLELPGNIEAYVLNIEDGSEGKQKFFYFEEPLDEMKLISSKERYLKAGEDYFKGKLTVENLGTLNQTEINIEVFNASGEMILNKESWNHFAIWEEWDGTVVDFIYPLLDQTLTHDEVYTVVLNGPNGTVSTETIATNKPVIDQNISVALNENERIYWLDGFNLETLSSKNFDVFRSNGDFIQTVTIEQLDNYLNNPLIITVSNLYPNEDYQITSTDALFQQDYSNTLFDGIGYSVLGLVNTSYADDFLYLNISGVKINLDTVKNVTLIGNNERFDITNYYTSDYLDGSFKGLTYTIPLEALNYDNYHLEVEYYNGNRHGYSFEIDKPAVYEIIENYDLVLPSTSDTIRGNLIIGNLGTMDTNDLTIEILDPVNGLSIIDHSKWQSVEIWDENYGSQLKFYYSLINNYKLLDNVYYTVTISGPNGTLSYDVYLTDEPIIERMRLIAYSETERIYEVDGDSLDQLVNQSGSLYTEAGLYHTDVTIDVLDDYVGDLKVVRFTVPDLYEQYYLEIDNAYFCDGGDVLLEPRSYPEFGPFKVEVVEDNVLITVTGTKYTVEDINELYLEGDQYINLLDYNYTPYEDDLFKGYTFVLPLHEVTETYYHLRLRLNSGGGCGTGIRIEQPEQYEIIENFKLVLPSNSDTIRGNLVIGNLGTMDANDLTIEILDPVNGFSIIDHSKWQSVEIWDDNYGSQLEFYYSLINNYKLLDNVYYTVTISGPNGTLSYDVYLTDEPIIERMRLIAYSETERIYEVDGDSLDQLVNQSGSLYTEAGLYHTEVTIDVLDDYVGDCKVVRFTVPDLYEQYYLEIDNAYFCDGGDVLLEPRSYPEFGPFKVEVVEDNVLITVTGMKYTVEDINELYLEGDQYINLLDYNYTPYEDDLFKGYTFVLPLNEVTETYYHLRLRLNSGSGCGNGIRIEQPKNYEIIENNRQYQSAGKPYFDGDLIITKLGTDNPEALTINVYDEEGMSILHKDEWHNVDIRVREDFYFVQFEYQLIEGYELLDNHNYTIEIIGPNGPLYATSYVTSNTILQNCRLIAETSTERVYRLSGNNTRLLEGSADIFSESGEWLYTVPIETLSDYEHQPKVIRLPNDSPNEQFRVELKDTYYQYMWSSMLFSDQGGPELGLVKLALNEDLYEITVTGRNLSFDNMNQILLGRSHEKIDLMSYDYVNYTNDGLTGYTFSVPVEDLNDSMTLIEVFFTNGSRHGTSIHLDLPKPFKILANNNKYLTPTASLLEIKLLISNLGTDLTEFIAVDVYDKETGISVIDKNSWSNEKIISDDNGEWLYYSYPLLNADYPVGTTFVIEVKGPNGIVTTESYVTNQPVLKGSILVGETESEKIYKLEGINLENIQNTTAEVKDEDGNVVYTVEIETLNEYLHSPKIIRVPNNNYLYHQVHVDKTYTTLYDHGDYTSLGLIKLDVIDQETIFHVTGNNFSIESIDHINVEGEASFINLLDYSMTVYNDNGIKGYSFTVPNINLREDMYLIEVFYTNGRKHGTNFTLPAEVFLSPLKSSISGKGNINKTQFNLNLKFKKTLPSGHFMIKDKTSGIDFKSKDIEWLVIGENQVRVKGTGTLKKKKGLVQFEVEYDANNNTIEVNIYSEDHELIYSTGEEKVTKGNIKIKK